MSTDRKFDGICIAVALFTLLITGLFMFGESFGIRIVHAKEAANTSSMFTKNDQNSAWDTTDATKIVMKGDTVSVSGNGAYYDGKDVHIKYAGKYILQGKLNSGGVKIKAEGDDKIWLLLDGVDISNEETAAIYIKKADKVFITLAEGSENRLEGGSVTENEKIDGAVCSKDDLTFNGSGKLTVTGNYRHGIACSQSLVFTGGTYEISAPSDGIHAKDSFRMKDSDITVTAGDDAIHAKNESETADVYVESGKITVTDCFEGLEGNTVLIAGGIISVHSRDDGINAAGKLDYSKIGITITGGTIRLDTQTAKKADGLDSNGFIDISAGYLVISLPRNGKNQAIDYGAENGAVCRIRGGTIVACGARKMTEGFEDKCTQGFIMMDYNGRAGAHVQLLNAAGETLISETVPYAFSNIVLSCPQLKTGDRVRVLVDEDELELTVTNQALEL